MIIYTSEKVMPYVYMGIHKETGEFYIGYREANIQPSHIDLPKYKTSSKLVKPIFDEFEWFIIAEFFDPISAYECEQQMIYHSIHDPLSINQQCRYQSKTMMRRSISDEEKLRLSTMKKGVPKSPETIERMKAAAKLRMERYHQNMTPEQQQAFLAGRKKAAETRKRNAKPVSDETRAKISTAMSGKPKSQSHRQQISERMKKQPPRPQTPETIQKMLETRRRNKEKSTK